MLFFAQGGEVRKFISAGEDVKGLAELRRPREGVFLVRDRNCRLDVLPRLLFLQLRLLDGVLCLD